MRFNRAKRPWSPVEISWLKENMDKLPITQLAIALARANTTIKNKIKELQGVDIPTTKGKKGRRSKIGKRKDCDNIFFRSSWEANLYRLLKHKGKQILRIEYEPRTFSFLSWHKHGTVHYTPDFLITYFDGTQQWIEVKGGLLESKDKTKIRRFKKYYPDQFKKLVAVTSGENTKCAKWFREEMEIPIWGYYPVLNKKYKNEIKGWE